MLDLLTMDEAARATSVSRDTIKRRRRRGDFPGAIRGPAVGNRPPPWLIPVGDLIAAGLTVARLDDPEGNEVTKPDAEVLALRLARADATVAARDLHIADLRAELRRLHEHLDRLATVQPRPDRDCASADTPDGSGLHNTRRSPDGY